MDDGILHLAPQLLLDVQILLELFDLASQPQLAECMHVEMLPEYSILLRSTDYSILLRSDAPANRTLVVEYE